MEYPSAHPSYPVASRWQGRPWLARLVRVVAWTTPVASSCLCVLLASRLLTRPAGGVGTVAWWAGLLLLGTAAMWITERLARRLLPLAALLRLSLAFPDAAPSRFGVALRSGNVRHLTRADQEAPAGTGAAGHRRRVRNHLPDGTSSAANTPAAATAELARMVGELHAHDRRTRGHVDRVRAYAVMLGQELRLDRDQIDRLQWAALLHDIGKLKVPSEILNKVAKLTDDEFDIIRTHPAEGARMLEPLRWWLGEWTDAAGQHHEKYDGTGYPLHLESTSISYAGRIVAVADAYDVMTAARSYKKPLDPVIARTELTRCAGTHFDPVVVRAFLSISIGRLKRATGPLSWLANIPIIGSAPLANAAAAAAAGTMAVLAPTVLTSSPPRLAEIGLSAPDTSTAATVPANAADAAPLLAEPTGDTILPAATGTAPGTTDVTIPSAVVPTTPTPAPTEATPTDDLSPSPATPNTDGGTVEPTSPTTAGQPLPDEPNPPLVPVGEVVTPQDQDLGTVTIASGGFKQLNLLAQTGAAVLLYGACDTGTFEFDGAGDPETITPQGATQPYRCEFQADRADGTTVRGSFTVQPT